MLIFSYASRGYEGELIKVETDLRRGMPGFDIVGLPDSAEYVNLVKGFVQL